MYEPALRTCGSSAAAPRCDRLCGAGLRAARAAGEFGLCGPCEARLRARCWCSATGCSSATSRAWSTTRPASPPRLRAPSPTLDEARPGGTLLTDARRCAVGVAVADARGSAQRRPSCSSEARGGAARSGGDGVSALPRAGWDHERRARELMPRREELLRRLPQRFPAARRFTHDCASRSSTTSIIVAAVGYEKARSTAPKNSVACSGTPSANASCAPRPAATPPSAPATRASTSPRWRPSATTSTPGTLALERAETPRRAAVRRAPARRRADRVRLPVAMERQGQARRQARSPRTPACRSARVRSAELAIEAKRERFPRIYSAGRLCGFLAPGIAALAAGEHGHSLEDAARLHLEIERCPTCRADYTRQLRYLRSARFNGKVAQLLPAPGARRPSAAAPGCAISSPTGSPGCSATTPALPAQLAGAGRGARHRARAQARRLLRRRRPQRLRRHRRFRSRPHHAEQTPATSPRRARRRNASPPSAQPPPRPPPRRPPRRHAARRRRRRPRSIDSRDTSTQGGTGSRSHEQSPASPAPANAAPDGASEFDPSYQPSAPAPPAPVPAAPGASEFQ